MYYIYKVLKTYMSLCMNLSGIFFKHRTFWYIPQNFEIASFNFLTCKNQDMRQWFTQKDSLIPVVRHRVVNEHTIYL